MKVEEYSKLDGLALAELIRTKQVTAREVLEASLAAIDRVNPQLNLIVHRVDPAAHPVADQNAAFAGVPFVLKDLTHRWAGAPSTMGSRIGKGIQYKEDGPIASRFRQAGFQLVGVAASSEFGMNAVTETVMHGPTRNPWDPSLSPGGSSGVAGGERADAQRPVGRVGCRARPCRSRRRRPRTSG